MVRILKHMALAAVLLAATACGGRRGPADAGQSAAAPATRPFPTIEIPSLIEEPAAQLEYLSMHYWDKCFDTTKSWLSDSTHIEGISSADMEQAFANFTYLLDNVSMDQARSAVKAFYGRIDDNAFKAVVDIVDRYLYDANSPVRNEDYYQPFAELVSKDERMDEDLRGSYAYNAEMSLLNRVGTRAADFTFCDKEGIVYSLYGIQAKYTLLFFSNPGCNACKEIIETLRNSPMVDDLIVDGILAVVNVYIDEDIEAWYGYMSYYPTDWYNGYDPNLVIRTDLLYNVRAIPSLYLLDERKVVLMKDAPEEKVFNFINNLQ